MLVWKQENRRQIGLKLVAVYIGGDVPSHRSKHLLLSARSIDKIIRKALHA